MRLMLQILLLLIIILLLRIIYIYLIFQQKHKMVGKILITWKIKTRGGNIKKDDDKFYQDDYYLSQHLTHDSNTHIHLITHIYKYSIYEFLKILLFIPSKIISLDYIVKKNDVHSHLIQIDYYNDSYLDICDQMEYLLFGE